MPLQAFTALGSEYTPWAVTTPEVDYDFFSAIGSPTQPVKFFVHILANITSSAPTIAAWKDDGINPASHIFMVISAVAHIKGAGGRGGDGGRSFEESPNQYWQSSGGGGAGQVVGPAGSVIESGNAGGAGTESAGGAAGASPPTIHPPPSDPYQGNVAPQDGGDAMRVGCPYTIINYNEIHGGGGGGCASFWSDGTPLYRHDATAGGSPGQPGASGFMSPGGAPYQAAGGYAIRLIAGAPAPTFITGGTSPNVEGTIGA